jgi:hypothetical protein
VFNSEKMDFDTGFSSGSDDADALVADLLQQSASTDQKEKEQASMTASAAETTSAVPPAKPVSEPRAYAVEVPIISNPDEYEFLPGHSTVRDILERKQTAQGLLYKVELESSDKEWVRSKQASLTPSFTSTLSNPIFTWNRCPCLTYKP